jgi:hypothetical protein
LEGIKILRIMSKDYVSERNQGTIKTTKKIKEEKNGSSNGWPDQRC